MGQVISTLFVLQVNVVQIIGRLRNHFDQLGDVLRIRKYSESNYFYQMITCSESLQLNHGVLVFIFFTF